MIALPKKSVTEEDVKATEARISESFANFKRALSDIPSEAARPVTDSVRAHPYAAMAAMAGAGFVAYRLIDVLVPRTKVVKREVTVQPITEIREKPARKPSLASRIVSEAIALATPYLTAYVQGELARLISKPQEKPDSGE